MVFIITIVIITILQGFGISTVMMILRVNIKEYRLWLCVTKLYFTNSLFLFQLDKLLFSFFTFTIFLYMFRTGWFIIRKIKCIFTRAASGTVPSVVDVSWVATHDTSTTEGKVPEAARAIKHLILLMMDQTVRNM